MDFVSATEVWASIQKIQEHINTINGELGKTMTDVAWLKASFWEMMNWVRVIGGGVVIGVVLSIWHLIVLKKNGKR